MEHRHSAPPAAAARRRAAADSRAPFHLPIALQPSTQSCRVICVRLRQRAQFGERESPRLRDQPADFERVIGEAVRRAAPRTAALSGSAVPLLRKVGDKSAAANSCAIALRPATSFATALVQLLGRFRAPSETIRFATGGRSRRAPSAPSGRERARRNGAGVAHDQLRSAMLTHGAASARHAIAAGDHRAQVVPESGDDHLEHVDQHERDQQPRDDEMDRARRLASAEPVDPAGRTACRATATSPRPIRMTSGSSTKITTRYASFCSTL